MKNLAIPIALLGLVAIILWYDDAQFLLGRNGGLLADHQLVAGPLVIGKISTQTSGLTYDEERRRLFAVGDRPPMILQLTPAGQFVRQISLPGFSDTEAIAHLGGDLFAVVSERPARLSWFRLPDEARHLDHSSATHVRLDPQLRGNKGLEGLTYAEALHRIYLVKERAPRKVLELEWPLAEAPITRPLESWRPGPGGWWGLRSLSGIHYHEPTGHLFILSRWSRAVVELTPNGKEVGRLYLKAGSAGLEQPIGAPEGITITEDGTLYICSEPDLLYIFAARGSSAPQI